MMIKYFKILLIPNSRVGTVLTFIFILIICVGMLIPLPQAVDMPGSDKWHHCLGFAVLTYPLTVASRRYWLSIIVFGLLFGALIEIIQPYVNRVGDIADFIADTIGVVIGFLFGVIGHFFKLKNDNFEWQPKQ